MGLGRGLEQNAAQGNRYGQLCGDYHYQEQYDRQMAIASQQAQMAAVMGVFGGSQNQASRLGDGGRNPVLLLL